MDEAVSRALQISYMERDQIERLHKREQQLGYLIPNWNIQTLFNLETIKERYGIRADNDILSSYCDYIKKQLKRLNLFAHEGEGLITCLNVEAAHSFDWNVFNHRGRVIWEMPVNPHKKSASRLQAIKEAKAEIENQPEPTLI